MSGAAFYFPSCLSWRIFIEVLYNLLPVENDLRGFMCTRT